MRFTPTAMMGSSLLGTKLQATATGAVSGTFSSGGIDYGFIKWNNTTGSYQLNITVGSAVDLLLVGGGAGGFATNLEAGNGGGGGGVNVITTRLGRGNFNITVGSGGTSGTNGNSTTFTGYNLTYTVGGGYSRLAYAPPGYDNGTSGAPQLNLGGMNANCAGGGNAAGGGGGASATGSSAFCPPSNRPDGANGGEGLTYNFDGTASVYGSGGGGGADNQAFAQGGIGGTNAGNGANYNTTPTDAINGFGGGGGGQRDGTASGGGRGGHGVLILRYRI